MQFLKVLLIPFWCVVLFGFGEAQRRDREKGFLIGELRTLQHEVSGKVWAVDEDTFYIEDFHYDGIGPDAFFWVGNSSQPSPRGTIVPYPIDSYGRSQKQLPGFDGKNLILRIPQGKISDLRWLSVWCRRFTVDFGHVLIPSNLDTPKKRQLPEFTRFGHAVRSGNVTILDAKTFYIPNLHYDGAGPDAYFWVGKGFEPDQLGQKVPNEVGRYEVLRSYEGEDIEIQLPDNLTVYDIDYLSIWCVEYRHNFGHVIIPPSSELWVPPALGQTRITPTWWYSAAEETAPVESSPAPSLPPPYKEDESDVYLTKTLLPPQLSNCLQLNDNFQLEWQPRQNEVQIRLVAKIPENKYMSFGLSPNQLKPEMLNSDITVAYFNKEENTFNAVDYTVTAKIQCDGVLGVCPDEHNNGRNDVQVIDGKRKDGITSVTFSRPYETNDRLDIPITRENREMTVIAAIGQLNSKMEANYHHEFVTKDKVTLDFNSIGRNTCNFKEPNKPAIVYKPWKGNIIREEYNFTANIGPTGGDRGYKAITNSSSWGYAWWINEMLIPELVVKRGHTYYFTIEGGDDQSNPSRNHPFYITSDPEGGFGQKTPDEQSKEKVYAGIAYSKMGIPYSFAYGRLCEWKHIGVDSWRESLTFAEYKSTLHNSCEDGQSGALVWTVQPETPDLVYYQCYTHRNLGWKIRVTDPGYNLARSVSAMSPSGYTIIGICLALLTTYSNFSHFR